MDDTPARPPGRNESWGSSVYAKSPLDDASNPAAAVARSTAAVQVTRLSAIPPADLHWSPSNETPQRTGPGIASFRSHRAAAGPRTPQLPSVPPSPWGLADAHGNHFALDDTPSRPHAPPPPPPPPPLGRGPGAAAVRRAIHSVLRPSPPPPSTMSRSANAPPELQLSSPLSSVTESPPTPRPPPPPSKRPQAVAGVDSPSPSKRSRHAKHRLSLDSQHDLLCASDSGGDSYDDDVAARLVPPTTRRRVSETSSSLRVGPVNSHPRLSDDSQHHLLLAETLPFAAAIHTSPSNGFNGSKIDFVLKSPRHQRGDPDGFAPLTPLRMHAPSYPFEGVVASSPASSPASARSPAVFLMGNGGAVGSSLDLLAEAEPALLPPLDEPPASKDAPGRFPLLQRPASMRPPSPSLLVSSPPSSPIVLDSGSTNTTAPPAPFAIAADATPVAVSCLHASSRGLATTSTDSLAAALLDPEIIIPSPLPAVPSPIIHKSAPATATQAPVAVIVSLPSSHAPPQAAKAAAIDLPTPPDLPNDASLRRAATDMERARLLFGEAAGDTPLEGFGGFTTGAHCMAQSGPSTGFQSAAAHCATNSHNTTRSRPPLSRQRGPLGDSSSPVVSRTDLGVPTSTTAAVPPQVSFAPATFSRHPAAQEALALSKLRPSSGFTTPVPTSASGRMDKFPGLPQDASLLAAAGDADRSRLLFGDDMFSHLIPGRASSSSNSPASAQHPSRPSFQPMTGFTTAAAATAATTPSFSRFSRAGDTTAIRTTAALATDRIKSLFGDDVLDDPEFMARMAGATVGFPSAAASIRPVEVPARSTVPVTPARHVQVSHRAVVNRAEADARPSISDTIPPGVFVVAKSNQPVNTSAKSLASAKKWLADRVDTQAPQLSLLSPSTSSPRTPLTRRSLGMRAPVPDAESSATATPGPKPGFRTPFKTPGRPPANAVTTTLATQAPTIEKTFQTPAVTPAAVFRTPLLPLVPQDLGSRSGIVAVMNRTPTTIRPAVAQTPARGTFKTPFKTPRTGDTSSSSSVLSLSSVLGRRPLRIVQQTPSRPQQRGQRPAAHGISPVFDCHSNSARRPLASLGHPQHDPETSANLIQSSVAAATFVFRETGWGALNAHTAILSAGADPRYISEKWTSNHYRWIVWKLAGMQSAWTHLSNEPKLVVPALCPEEIVRELLYRYQREICQVDRSCLHKIVERDELPARPMVLCIAQCIEQQTAPPDAGSTSSQQYLLELSDGWHSVVATVDTTLESAIRRGKLRVGSKISVVGASLSGEDATSALDLVPDWHLDRHLAGSAILSTSPLRLRLHANGTKLARWDAPLGFARSRMPVALRALTPTGGPFGSILVQVLRVFPLIYMETLPSGNKMYRNQREEAAAQREFERNLPGVHAACVAIRSARAADQVSDETLARAFVAGALSDLLASIPTQLATDLDARARCLADRVLGQIKAEISRVVVPFQRLRVACALESAKLDADGAPQHATTVALTVWRPASDFTEHVKEGAYYWIENGTVSGQFNNAIRLASTRHTEFRPTTGPPPGVDRAPTGYIKRQLLTDFSALPSRDPESSRGSHYEQVDIQGIIVRAQRVRSTATLELHMADTQGQFVHVRLMERMWLPGFHDSLQPGTRLKVTNARISRWSADTGVLSLLETSDESDVRKVSVGGHLSASELQALQLRLEVTLNPQREQLEDVDWVSFFQQTQA